MTHVYTRERVYTHENKNTRFWAIITDYYTTMVRSAGLRFKNNGGESGRQSYFQGLLLKRVLPKDWTDTR